MRSAFRLCLDALNINHTVSLCACVSLCVCGGAFGHVSVPELLSGLHDHKVPGVVDPLVQHAVPLLKKERRRKENTKNTRITTA